MIAYGAVIETAIGGSGADTIFASNSGSSLYGGLGDDILNGGDGDDFIDGGAGLDTISYSSANSGVTVDLSLTGAQHTEGAGVDTIRNVERLIGSQFDDILRGGANADYFSSGAGDDYIVSNAGNDEVRAGDGADYVNAGAGNDLLYGEAGADTLNAGSGADSLYGGEGNDILIGGDGDDMIDGGAGVDNASYCFSNSGVTVNLALIGAQNTGGSGTDTILNVESLTGSGYNDVLRGDGGANVINGGNGNDILYGAAGDDTLDGGDGLDTLTGGAGADAFCINWSNFTSGQADIIADFSVVDDTIQIARVYIGSNGSTLEGLLASNAFYVGSGAHDADDRIIYNSATGLLMFDQDGNGSAAAINFAQLSTGLVLTSADFRLV